jgi:hypothetical protein
MVSSESGRMNGLAAWHRAWTLVEIDFVIVVVGGCVGLQAQG